MIRVTETELHSLEEQLTPPPDQQATVDELARSGTLSLLYVEREPDRTVVMVSAPLANAVCLLERTPPDEWTAEASMTVFAGSATNTRGVTLLGTASSIDPDAKLVALSGRAGSNVSSLTVLADGGNTPVAMVDGWFGVVSDVNLTTGGAADGPDLDGQFGVQVEVRYTDGQTEVLTW